MNIWCESALQASLVRNIFQAFLFICLIPLLSIVYSSRDQLDFVGDGASALNYTLITIILFSTKVFYDIVTVIRTLSNI